MHDTLQKSEIPKTRTTLINRMLIVQCDAYGSDIKVHTRNKYPHVIFKKGCEVFLVFGLCENLHLSRWSGVDFTRECVTGSLYR